MTAVGDTLYVFGGQGIDTEGLTLRTLNDLWAIRPRGNGSNGGDRPKWKQLCVSCGPSPRRSAAIATTASGTDFFVFGGYDGSMLYGDLWRYGESSVPSNDVHTTPFRVSVETDAEKQEGNEESMDAEKPKTPPAEDADTSPTADNVESNASGARASSCYHGDGLDAGGGTTGRYQAGRPVEDRSEISTGEATESDPLLAGS